MFLHTLVFLIVINKVLSEKCICVPIYHCKDFASVENYGYEKLNIWKYPCANQLDVCCNVKCGVRQTDNLPFHHDLVDDRLLGSTHVAKFAEFPWMLAILLGNHHYKCGGSLIHPRVALTAAHCVQEFGHYKIRAGEWDRSNHGEPLEHQDRFSMQIIIHPYFDPSSLVNDIAIIILNRPFVLSENVGLICLPSPYTKPMSNQCTVTGWGKTSPENVHLESVLNKRTFRLVPHSECEAILQKVRFGPNFYLHPTFICAGNGTKEACKGDGGSPLISEIGKENVYEQFGVVSWGLTCGITEAPGVYVGVANYIFWIDHHMALHGLISDVYKSKK